MSTGDFMPMNLTPGMRSKLRERYAEQALEIDKFHVLKGIWLQAWLATIPHKTAQQAADAADSCVEEYRKRWIDGQ